MPSLPADARHSAAATQGAPDLIRLGIDGVLSGLLSVSSDPEKRAIRPRSAEHSHSRWPKTTSTPLKVGNLFLAGGASPENTAALQKEAPALLFAIRRNAPAMCFARLGMHPVFGSRRQTATCSVGTSLPSKALAAHFQN